MRVLLFVSIFLVAACNSVSRQQPPTHDLNDTLSMTELFSVDPEIATQVFLKTMFHGADTTISYFYQYDGEENSRVYYLRAGHVFNKQDTAALALYSISDTACVCAAYNCTNGVWHSAAQTELNVQRLNSTDFRVDHSDFNFDGETDVFVNFFTTSTAQDVGVLLTYDAVHNRLAPHPETACMTAPVAHAAQRIVVAKVIDEASGRWLSNAYCFVNDTLQLCSSRFLDTE